MGRVEAFVWREARMAVEVGLSGAGGGGGRRVWRNSWPLVRPRRRKVVA